MTGKSIYSAYICVGSKLVQWGFQERAESGGKLIGAGGSDDSVRPAGVLNDGIVVEIS